MEKKPKMRSFAKRLTRWIVIMQFIVMGFATYWIYSFIKGFGEMEETDLYRSYLTNSNANISRILSNNGKPLSGTQASTRVPLF